MWWMDDAVNCKWQAHVMSDKSNRWCYESDLSAPPGLPRMIHRVGVMTFDGSPEGIGQRFRHAYRLDQIESDAINSNLSYWLSMIRSILEWATCMRDLKDTFLCIFTPVENVVTSAHWYSADQHLFLFGFLDFGLFFVWILKGRSLHVKCAVNRHKKQYCLHWGHSEGNSFHSWCWYHRRSFCTISEPAYFRQRILIRHAPQKN